MTVTDVTDVTASLSDEEYEAALARVREYRAQLDRAGRLADKGSLEVARALAAIFADGRWADELPPVKRAHVRGRPVDPRGRSRFATWARDPEHTRGWAPRTTYQFLNAAIVAQQLSAHAQTMPDSEAALRPLTSLMAKGQDDLIPSAWDLAARRAGGTPSMEQVKAAVAELRPKSPAKGSTARSQPSDWSDAIFAEFHSHLIARGRLRDAGLLIMRMKEAYDAALAASRGN